MRPVTTVKELKKRSNKFAELLNTQKSIGKDTGLLVDSTETLETEFGVKFGSEMNVPVKMLTHHPENRRLFPDEATEDDDVFLEDIRQNGIHTAIIINRKDQVLCGNRRLRLSRKLELTHIPAKYITTNITEKQEIDLMIRDNLIRRQLSVEQRKRVMKSLTQEDRMAYILARFPEETIINSGKGIDTRNDTVKLRKTAMEEMGVAGSTVTADLAALRDILDVDDDEKLTKLKDKLVKSESKLDKINVKLEKEIALLRDKYRPEIRKIRETIAKDKTAIQKRRVELLGS